MFIKTGGSETKEGFKVEATGERLGGSLFWLPENVIGHK